MPQRAAFAPVTPDGDEARRWAESELSKPVYAEAQPTLIDRISRAIGDFVRDLFSAGLPDATGAAFTIVAAIVVAALVIAALLIWGLPRAQRRSQLPAGELFGDHEARAAAELRRDAASLAAQQEWSDAIVLRYRALARSLTERGVLETPPGSTVHAFARAAGRPFPAFADDLEAAATAFDDVRYLRRPGSRELYERVAAVDDGIAAARPVSADRPGEVLA